MGYPRDPDLYPPEYRQLYIRALTETVRVEVGDERKAKHLRHRLHAYRRAVEISKLQGWSELRKIIIRIEESTLVLEREPTFVTHSVAQVSDEELDKYIQEFEGDSDGKET